MSENNSRYVDRPGAFRCIVKEPTSGWFGEAGEKNTPYIRIIGEVADDGDQNGKTITYFAWLSDGAFDRTIKNLVEVFGWNGDLVALDNGQFTFAGMECQIVAEFETHDGKTKIKAKWLNVVGGGEGKEMAKEKVASLLAKLGGKAKALAKANPAPKVAAKPAPSAAATPAAGQPEDDDIPF